MSNAESMRYADFDWATKLNRFSLNIIGIWPKAHGNVLDKFLSNLRAIFFLLLLVYVGIIPSIHSLLRIWRDIIAMIDNLQFTIPLVIMTAKFMVIWWKKADLTLVLNMMANDWSKTKTDKELSVMIKHAQTARIITIYGYVVMTVGFSLVIFLPFFGISMRYITNMTDPIKILPLQAHYFYDKNQSPYYELTYASQIVMAIIGAVGYTGLDNFLALLVFHLCGQMENLKEHIVNIRQFKNFNDGLAFFIKEHIRIIKYFNIVENTFTVLLLALLVYVGILFSLYGFLIIAVLREGKQMSTMRLIFLISVILNICGHMCLQCVAGDILVTHCEGIYHAAYDYDWYNLEPEEARTLILIMIRVNEPLHITAGKIFPMTLSMFCNLLKTSGGYVSVLLARQGS